MHNSGLTINIGNNHGIRAGGCQGQHGPQGPQASMMRMMQSMLSMMSQMMGGGPQQGGACCPHHSPNFGHGNAPGININLGSNIQGFLG